MRLKSIVMGLLLTLLATSSAFAQCSGNPAPGRLCANVGASSTLPTWATMTSALDRNFGAPSGEGSILNRGASSWSSTRSPSLGLNGVAGGSLILRGATSGSATLSVAAAAGSSTFRFPVDNGTANQVLITDGNGNTSWTTAGAGTVSSVGLAMPGIFSVTGSPVTGLGTLTATLATQAANLVWAGPTIGAASSPTFRALVGADLPNPSAGTLGGVQSFAAVPSQWIRQISTSGVPTASQPTFTDISGTLTPSQCPNPSASSIGCVQSFALQTSKWISSISTSGVPSATQPSFTDISGSVSPSQLPSIGNNSVLGNVSGGTAIPVGITASNVLDIIGSTQGQVIYRGASGWAALSPGTSGQVLTTSGGAANPSWTTVTGTGTVTNVASGVGLTGGPITTTGTLSLANIGSNTILSNVTGGSTTPSANTMTAILDATLGSTQGNIIYRGASNWVVLAPGTNGQVLTQGASTPSWASAGSVSNVTISSGAGISVSGTCTISTTGTCTVTNGGVTSVASQTGALTIAATNPLTNSGTVLSVTQATKANQQTGTSNAVAVTPLHQQDHDSAAKIWVMFTGSAVNGGQAINAGYNLTSVVRSSLGIYVVTFATAFASSAYACVASSNGGTTDGAVEFITQTASTITAVFKTFSSGSQFDPVNGAYVVCYGRQ